MTNLADTSVPPWVLNCAPAALDETGAAYLLVGVGADAAALLKQWHDELPGRRVTVIAEADVAHACAALTQCLLQAQVGVRVRLAGPAGACLKVRAAALAAGLEDDEIAVVASGPSEIEVFCTHCRATTSTRASIGEVVACRGCGRNLLVYHHVSRRTGQFMGFMADAEAASR